MKVQITIIICTYNREDLITGCLDSLRDQSAPLSQFEVIVIDNNSTDRTSEIISNYRDLPNLRMVKEINQGLSHARNRGIQESKSDFLAFLDDDARAHPDYVKNAISLIMSLGKSVVCFGGPILPFFTSSKPDWFLDKYETRRDWDSPRYLSKGQSFSGSNSIWQRSTLIEIDGFDVNAGVVGYTMQLGEETTVFEEIWQLNENPKLYYSPGLIVYHWVPDYKMTPSYCFRRNIAGGQYLSKHNRRNLHKTDRIFQLLIDIFRGGVRAMMRVFRFRHWQNWIFEEWPLVFQNTGELFGVIGIHPRFTQRKEMKQGRNK